ncbi:MAG: hypothetical protein KAS64_05360 [Spirochaetes bacterium]|nr:hypothetical protein [Spirochaetota bacterium]
MFIKRSHPLYKILWFLNIFPISITLVYDNYDRIKHLRIGFKTFLYIFLSLLIPIILLFMLTILPSSKSNIKKASESLYKLQNDLGKIYLKFKKEYKNHRIISYDLKKLQIALKTKRKKINAILELQNRQLKKNETQNIILVLILGIFASVIGGIIVEFVKIKKA